MPLSSVVGAQSIVKPGVCTSSTRPASPYDGQMIYETDTDATKVWNGSAWVGATNTASLNGVGTWTSYTPTWASTGTQPVLGNGTIVARYSQMNKTILVQIALIAGSTTTFGTGTYTFTYPLTANPMGSYNIMLTDGMLYDSNVGAGYRLSTTVNAGSTSNFRVAYFSNSSQTFALLGATAPVTLTVSDEIYVNFMYEAA